MSVLRSQSNQSYSRRLWHYSRLDGALAISRGRMDQLLNEGRIKYVVDPVIGWRLIEVKEIEKLRGRKPGGPAKNRKKR